MWEYFFSGIEKNGQKNPEWSEKNYQSLPKAAGEADEKAQIVKIIYFSAFYW